MNALYYPFHLCHARTLARLLADYSTVHFRDFMALQLTPMVGTTAFPDRMGDEHPESLKAGRIIQGHNVSGAMSSETSHAVNRDLADAQWRELFQESLLNNRRFQRGLFPEPRNPSSGTIETQAEPEWVQFCGMEWAKAPFQVETVQTLSRQRPGEEEAAHFEYGWALIKTSASLIYTIQLCHELNVSAVTDSSSHYDLLAQTCKREQIPLIHRCVKREGY
jgi:hypothetical protein